MSWLRMILVVLGIGVVMVLVSRVSGGETTQDPAYCPAWTEKAQQALEVAAYGHPHLAAWFDDEQTAKTTAMTEPAWAALAIAARGEPELAMWLESVSRECGDQSGNGTILRLGTPMLSGARVVWSGGKSMPAGITSEGD